MDPRTTRESRVSKDLNNNISAKDLRPEGATLESIMSSVLETWEMLERRGFEMSPFYRRKSMDEISEDLLRDVKEEEAVLFVLSQLNAAFTRGEESAGNPTVTRAQGSIPSPTVPRGRGRPRKTQNPPVDRKRSRKSKSSDEEYTMPKVTAISRVIRKTGRC